jgi:RNA polymerase sigma factor (sigma-70 family)
VEDDRALAEFCRAEWPRLVGSLSLDVGSRELAEDLAQETLAKVCTHWRRVRKADSPSAWAHRVAFNLAKSHGRRQGRWARVQPLLAARPLGAVDLDRASALAVRDALATLPTPQRQALILRYFADLSVRDTAAAMRCPENTVKTHTRRALEALRLSGLLDDEIELADEPDHDEEVG